MTEHSKTSPIFIHSLFRSGSTYVFKAFRRLGAGYTCFQEPLHEITVQAASNPQLLIDDQGSDKARELRHPQLDSPYFAELAELGPDVLQQLSEPEVYTAWFAPATQPCGLDFWRALIDKAAARPVIQECRSAGRIALIREQLGGFHALLWRNPRDQWWSYQVSPYFDLTTQLTFNAASPPEFIKQVASHIDFVPQPNPLLAVTYDWYLHRPLAPDQAYQAFYALWLLVMHTGLQHADLLVSIDSLTADPAEREKVIQRFESEGVQGLDFSDCDMPASWYSAGERAHFEALEQEIHDIWGRSGLAESDLDAILELRRQHDPERFRAESLPATVTDELARYRDLIRRKQNDLISQGADSDQKLQASHRREDLLRDEAARQKALDASRLAELRTELISYQETLQRLVGSRSWKVTEPLRLVSHYLYVARGPEGRARVRRLVLPWLTRALTGVDRVTSRYPRVRAALLSALCRMPPLFRIVERVSRQRHAPPPIQHQVHLSSRGRDIYRELTAEMERYQSQREGSQI